MGEDCEDVGVVVGDGVVLVVLVVVGVVVGDGVVLVVVGELVSVTATRCAVWSP